MPLPAFLSIGDVATSLFVSAELRRALLRDLSQKAEFDFRFVCDLCRNPHVLAEEMPELVENGAIRSIGRDHSESASRTAAVRNRRR
jgi:hypothetical protein